VCAIGAWPLVIRPANKRRASGAGRALSFAQHSPRVLDPHFIGDAVRDSRTSSANGALGRHGRQESAGMRLVTAASGSRQLQHWLPIRASQFLRIRMDMSHEAAKEVAFTIYMIQERSRLNASREMSDAPIPASVPTKPWAKLNLPVPFVRSATIKAVSTPKALPLTPSSS
jgi:hypothetical protein